MAKGLTRKFLTALGIDEDKADQIIDQHTAVTDELKQERDSYKADADRLKTVQDELNTAKTDLEALKKATGGENPFEKKYNDLKAEYDKYKGDVAAKETKAAQEKAFRGMLKEIGVSDKRIDSIIKVSDIGKVEFDKDGKFKNKDDLSKAAKEEWSEFIPTKSQAGAKTENPPANGGKAFKIEDLYKTDDKGRLIMGDKERLEAIAATLDE